MGRGERDFQSPSAGRTVPRQAAQPVRQTSSMGSDLCPGGTAGNRASVTADQRINAVPAHRCLSAILPWFKKIGRGRFWGFIIGGDARPRSFYGDVTVKRRMDGKSYERPHILGPNSANRTYPRRAQRSGNVHRHRAKRRRLFCLPFRVLRRCALQPQLQHRTRSRSTDLLHWRDGAPFQ